MKGAIMEGIQEIIIMEKAVAQKINDLVQKIANEVSHVERNNVRNLSANCCVVSFSALEKTILSPEYYLQSVQAELVRNELKTATTATAFQTRIQRMCENGKTKTGEKLTDSTLAIMQKYL